MIDIDLQVGDANQSVTMDAAAPLLNAANASTGQLTAAPQVEDLPLNGARETHLFLRPP